MVESVNSQSNRRFRTASGCGELQCLFPMTPATETRLRVRYAETDQMGVVYYANYLVWMEVGRVELCRPAASTTGTWSGGRHLPGGGRSATAGTARPPGSTTK